MHVSAAYQSWARSVAILHWCIPKAAAKSACPPTPAKRASATAAEYAAVPALKRSKVVIAIALCLAASLSGMQNGWAKHKRMFSMLIDMLYICDNTLIQRNIDSCQHGTND